MSSFHPATPDGMTFYQDELDRAAVEDAGIVRSIGYGYATSRQTPRPQHGYRFRWVNTRGMGNHGELVLIGASRHARECLTRGRVARIQRDLDVSYDTAVAVELSSRRIRYGNESQVLAAAVRLACLTPEVLASYPGSGSGARRWSERHYPCELTMPRLDAAVEIAGNCLGGGS